MIGGGYRAGAGGSRTGLAKARVGRGQVARCARDYGRFGSECSPRDLQPGVNVVIRNDAGTQIGTGSVALAAQGHSSFMLADATSGFPATAGVRGTVEFDALDSASGPGHKSGGWAVTAGMRGTIEFDTPAGGWIAPLGLRAATIPGGYTLTTIPVMVR